MIKVKITVPSIGREFDMEYNEKSCVSDVILDTLEVLSRHLHMYACGDKNWVLMTCSDGCLMWPDKSLSYYNINNGDCLILI